MEKRLKKSRYITGFDGIRAIAVIGVILYHLLPNVMQGGYLGVPIFFVLSGYLITDLLCQEWEQNERIDIRQFYSRRMKRLYPALVCMLVLASAYITLFQRNLLTNLRAIVSSSLLYLNNWWQIAKGFSYFDRFANESPFTHIWSLAVEGQHYIIWPILFLLLKKYLKQNRKIFYVLVTGSLVSAILMAVLYTPGSDPTRVYYGTDTRLFSIWLGSALAFVWPSTRLKEEIPKRAQLLLDGIGAGAFVLLLLAMWLLNDRFSFVYYGGLYLVSIVSAVLVAITAHPGAHWNRWLTNPICKWLGQRSYGIYLYQFPIMIFYETKVRNIGDHPLVHAVIELVLILAASELSYRFIEQPLRRFHYRDTWKTIKQWGRRPFLNRQKLWLVPAILLSVIALAGLIMSPPANSMTAQQAELQERINQNKEIADKSKQDALKQQSGTADTGESNSSEADSTAEDVSTNFGLTDEELQRATKVPLTAFGDSVMLDATDELQSVFTNIVVDGDVGRQLYDSAPLIEKLIEKKLLKENVLVGLGTNGSFTEAQFDEIMNAIGDRRVYWVNVRVPTRRWQNDVNNLLQKMDKKYENMTVIDWYAASNEHDDWFYEDQVHPNPEGMTHYISLVSKAILDDEANA